MKSTEFIRMSLENGMEWCTGTLEDLRATPLAQPTPNGGNHALWIAGHLAHSESGMLDEILLGKENRFPEWEPIFGMGSTPGTDASVYPDFDMALKGFKSVRADSLKHLAGLSEDELSAAPAAPVPEVPVLGTVGGVFSVMVMHMMHHTGQAADVRRALGKPVLMG